MKNAVGRQTPEIYDNLSDFKGVFVYQNEAQDFWDLGSRNSLLRYREVLYVLVSRNLKVRYRGSLLGVYWSLLNPLIMTSVYTLIFGTAFASYYDHSILRYMLGAFSGLAVLNFFSSSTTQALTSIVLNGSLMNKIRLPVSIFPVSMIAANVFQFSVGALPLLVIMTLLISHSFVNVVALFLPLLALVLVATGVGLLVSALFVFFRDLSYFYELVLFLLLISSPIFYPQEIVPANVRAILVFNPLSSIIASLRQIAISGHAPDYSLIGHALLSGALTLVVGWICFRRWHHQFMDLL
jgi:lipopolysaccharide transport system permease protein